MDGMVAIVGMEVVVEREISLRVTISTILIFNGVNDDFQIHNTFNSVRNLIARFLFSFLSFPASPQTLRLL